MLQKLHQSHPGYSSVETTFENFAEQAVSAKQEYGSILALYGAATYFDVESYKNVEQLLAPGGNYFLMFYRPGYYPAHIYGESEIAALRSRQNFEAIYAAFDNKYLFSKYLVATNLELPLEKFQPVGAS
jgi:hypothetical protein